jgi:hypothetical protein
MLSWRYGMSRGSAMTQFCLVVLLQLVCFGTPCNMWLKLSGTGLLASMRCGAHFKDICQGERMQCNGMQCNAVTEGHTSSSIFRSSSTTGSKFAASLGKNLTTTLYPLNHRQMYVTAGNNTDVEQPAHASGVSVRAWQSAKQTSLHSQHHRLNPRDRKKAGLCSGAVQRGCAAVANTPV